MEVAVFSSKSYVRDFLNEANKACGHGLRFLRPGLSPDTAPLGRLYPAVCVFVNDDVSRPVLEELAAGGTRLIALRCAGFNNVDLAAAGELGLRVARVPAYSPYAVAEHTVGLMLALNRRIHRAYARVRESNLALEGLLGFDMHGRTVGIIGTGKIGQVVARIMAGFGCALLGYDTYPSEACRELGLQYVSLEELARRSDIITLHCPLTPETHHMIDRDFLRQAKKGVMLINTSRGKLIDTPAVVAALKSGKVGYVGLDVYEEEGHLFFEDLSNEVLQDDVFARLLTFPNVIITGHQGFFTAEALRNIAETTLANITAFEREEALENEVTAELQRR